MPDTNARYLRPELFPELPSVAAIDVSFISLKLILLPVLSCLSKPGEIVALIKPQFELTPKQVPGGIVKSEEYRQEAVSGLRQFLKEKTAPQFQVEDAGIIESPLKGAKGNIEYLWHITLPALV